MTEESTESDKINPEILGIVVSLDSILPPMRNGGGFKTIKYHSNNPLNHSGDDWRVEASNLAEQGIKTDHVAIEFEMPGLSPGDLFDANAAKNFCAQGQSARPFVDLLTDALKSQRMLTENASFHKTTDTTSGDRRPTNYIGISPQEVTESFRKPDTQDKALENIANAIKPYRDLADHRVKVAKKFAEFTGLELESGPFTDDGFVVKKPKEMSIEEFKTVIGGLNPEIFGGNSLKASEVKTRKSILEEETHFALVSGDALNSPEAYKSMQSNLSGNDKCFADNKKGGITKIFADIEERKNTAVILTGLLGIGQNGVTNFRYEPENRRYHLVSKKLNSQRLQDATFDPTALNSKLKELGLDVTLERESDDKPVYVAAESLTTESKESIRKLFEAATDNKNNSEEVNQLRNALSGVEIAHVYPEDRPATSVTLPSQPTPAPTTPAPSPAPAPAAPAASTPVKPKGLMDYLANNSGMGIGGIIGIMLGFVTGNPIVGVIAALLLGGLGAAVVDGKDGVLGMGGQGNQPPAPTVTATSNGKTSADTGKSAEVSKKINPEVLKQARAGASDRKSQPIESAEADSPTAPASTPITVEQGAIQR